MMEIVINGPIKEKDLINEIKSLKKPDNKSIKKEPKDENSTFLLSSISNKKQKKKKNKNKLNVELMTNGHISDGYSEVERVSEEEEKSNLLDIEEIFREKDEDDIDKGIINEQNKSYNKLKKEQNEYKKEFAEELTLLYNLLKETSEFGDELEKKYLLLDNSKVRGVSKYMNDLAATILVAKGNKLNILREIASIKKVIADLKIKSDTKNKTTDNNNNPEYLASSYLRKILNYGRNNFIKDYKNHDENDEDEYNDKLLEQIEKNRAEAASTYSDEETDYYNKIIDDKLDNSDNPYRSDEGNKYIEYENRGVKIFIKRYIHSGEWEFIAIDKDKQQVFDYPIPRKRDAGRIKFSSDGSYATDERGRTYKIIEVNDEEDE
jgi:hypothetical protein